MPYILLPERWKRQPRGNVEIDWNNSITTGLSACFSGGKNFVEVVSGYFDDSDSNPGDDVGTVATRYDSGAIGYEADQYLTLPSACVTKLCNETGYTKNIFTLDMVFRDTGNTPYLDVYPNVGTWAQVRLFSNQLYIYCTNFSNKYWYWNSDATAAPLLTSTGKRAGHLLASVSLASGAADTKVYGNGVPLSYSSTSGSITGNVQFQSAVFSVACNSWGQRNTGVATARIWNRNLSNGEAQSLAENPWQVFRKKREVRYFNIPTVTPKYRRDAIPAPKHAAIAAPPQTALPGLHVRRDIPKPIYCYYVADSKWYDALNHRPAKWQYFGAKPIFQASPTGLKGMAMTSMGSDYEYYDAYGSSSTVSVLCHYREAAQTGAGGWSQICPLHDSGANKSAFIIDAYNNRNMNFILDYQSGTSTVVDAGVGASDKFSGVAASVVGSGPIKIYKDSKLIYTGTANGNPRNWDSSKMYRSSAGIGMPVFLMAAWDVALPDGMLQELSSDPFAVFEQPKKTLYFDATPVKPKVGPAIILPDSRDRRPTYNLRLQESGRLSDGLIDWVAGDSLRDFTIFGNIARTYLQGYGPCWKCNAGTGASMRKSAGGTVSPPLTVATLMFPVNPGNNAIFGGFGSTSSISVTNAIRIPIGPGISALSSGSSTTGEAITGDRVTTASGKVLAAVGIFASTTSRTIVARGAAPVTNTTLVADADVDLLCANAIYQAGAHTGGLHFMLLTMFWNRALSLEEAQVWLADPWQCFVRDKKAHYFLSPGTKHPITGSAG